MRSASHAFLIGCSAAAVLALAACSSTPKQPPASLTSARAAMDAANAADMNQYAPLETRNARERLQAAEAAWRAEDYDQAARLGDEALAMERLAEAKVGEGRAREAKADVERTINTLQAETAAPGNVGTVGSTGATSAPAAPLPPPTTLTPSGSRVR
jgi:hypothetical protein